MPTSNDHVLVNMNDLYRLLPALAGLLGTFILDLLTPLGIAVWIGYVFPIWYVSRFSTKTALSLPLVALACTGLVVAGYFLSPPGMNASYAAVNRTMGVLFFWLYTFLLMRSGAVDKLLETTQEQLRQSEARFRMIADAAPVLIWIAGLDKLRNYFNKGWLDFTGRTIEQEVGNGWLEGVHADDAHRCLKTYVKAFDKRESFEMEYRLRRFDGAFRWILARGQPRFGSGGDFLGYIGSCIDIGDRKQAEEALARSERNLSDFFDNASIGLHWVGPDGIILKVNQTELTLLGYSREEYVGRHIAEFHVDEPIIQDILTRLTCGETLHEYPARLRCKDGSIREVLINSNVLFEEDRFVHTRCFTRDVTDGKRAEEALRLSEARKGAILDSALDCLITMDSEGRVQEFNPAAVRTFGYTREDAMGRTVAELIIPSRLREAHWLGFRRFLDTGHSTVLGRRIEMPALRADGTEIPIELSISVTRLTGQPPFFTAYLRDITDRKKAEEDVAALAAIVTSSDDAIISMNLEGFVRSWNRAAERLFGYTVEEMMGQPVSLLIPPDRIGEEHMILERIRRGEKTDHYETIRRRKDGTDLHVSLTVSPLMDAHGTVIGASKISRNITEQKRVEAALRERDGALTAANNSLKSHAAALAEANKELEGFSYSVSHDLRAPLRTIDAFTRMVEEDHGSHLNGEAHRCLAIVRKAAAQAGELIDDLLELSRLGRQGMEFRSVKMGDLAQAALDDLRTMQGNRTIDLRMAELPPCQGDRRLLKLVWTNLLTNAFKYTQYREEARIEVGWMPDDASADAVTYFVKDDGVGFDMKYVHKLFGVFQRLHRKEDFDGTGVGLAIVQRIVNRHGGRAWAEGKVDGGATFFFSVRKATA